MSDARIREVVAELERLIPRDNAQVILHDDGDSMGTLPTCATQNGFLRFGLAFMKAAFAESGKGLQRRREGGCRCGVGPPVPKRLKRGFRMRASCLDS